MPLQASSDLISRFAQVGTMVRSIGPARERFQGKRDAVFHAELRRAERNDLNQSDEARRGNGSLFPPID
jgi:hypothetical protein